MDGVMMMTMMTAPVGTCNRFPTGYPGPPECLIVVYPITGEIVHVHRRRVVVVQYHLDIVFRHVHAHHEAVDIRGVLEQAAPRCLLDAVERVVAAVVRLVVAPYL